MKKLSEKEKQELLDKFGERVIGHVRDISLKSAMGKAKVNTVNPVKKEQYSGLSNLSEEEKELVCDLLSETITITIYNFLDMFEAYSDEMKLNVIHDNNEYDLCSITEKMGGEIAFADEDGWIQKFSKIGRFVL